MAIVVEKLLAVLGWKADSSGLRKLQREGERTQRAVGSKLQRAAAGSERGVRRLGTRGAAAIGQASVAAGKLEGKLSKVKVAAVAGLAAVGAGATKAFGEAVRANKEYESLRTRLTTLVGDQAEADKVFGQLEEFAQTTPFKLAEVADAYIQLRGAGFDMSDANMRALGDLSAASNKSLGELTEMLKGAGRGMGAMVDNFIGLAGKAEKGKLRLTNTRTGADELVDPKDRKALLQFFTDAGKANGIKGGMEALSKTIGGMMSRMADQADAFFREVGKAGLNEGLRTFFDDVMSAGEGGTNFARILGVVLKGGLEAAGTAVKFLRSNWKLLLAGFGALLQVVFPLLGPLVFLAVALDDVRAYIQGGDSLLGRFIKKFRDAPGPAGELARLLLRAFGFIRQGVQWLAANAPAIIAMIQGKLGDLTSGDRFERFKQIMERVFTALLRIAGPLLDVLIIVLPLALKIAAAAFLLLLAIAGPVLEGVASLVEWCASTFTSVVEAIASVGESLRAQFLGPLERGVETVTNLLAKLAQLAGFDVGGFAAGLSASGGARTAGIAAAGATRAAGGTTNTNTTTANTTNNVTLNVTEAQASAAGGPAALAGTAVGKLSARNATAGAG